MHRDDAAPNRIQRLLNASCPLFRAFGAEVRAHWSVVLLPVLAFTAFRFYADYSQQQAAVWTAAWTLGLCATLWTHETAHVLAARRFGVAPRTIELTPLGVLAHAESALPSARVEILTAIAGPLSQVAWVVALGVPRLIFLKTFAEVREAGFEVWPRMYDAFLAYQAFLLLFNLLPCYPLDGGRVLRGVLARRMQPAKAALTTAYLGYGGAVTTAIFGVGVLADTYGQTLPAALAVGTILLWIGVSSFFACRQLQTQAQRAAISYEPVEVARQGRGDDAWKDSIAESERLSRAEERRERRAAEARRQEEVQHKRLQERIDELLDRINEVGGVERLTAAERLELAEASELLRKETAEH